jgi:hypothetical protein
MWYAIGYILFALFVFALIYGAGKANKTWDKATDDYFKSLKQKQDGHY